MGAAAVPGFVVAGAVAPFEGFWSNFGFAVLGGTTPVAGFVVAGAGASAPVEGFVCRIRVRDFRRNTARPRFRRGRRGRRSICSVFGGFLRDRGQALREDVGGADGTTEFGSVRSLLDNLGDDQHFFDSIEIGCGRHADVQEHVLAGRDFLHGSERKALGEDAVAAAGDDLLAGLDRSSDMM